MNENPTIPGTLTVTGTQLAHLLKPVVLAASTYKARPILTGVLLTVEDETITAVATDSYRCHETTDTPDMDNRGNSLRVLIPAEFITRWIKTKPGVYVTVVVSDQTVTFTDANGSMVTQAIDGEYPNYKQLFPSPDDAHVNSPGAEVAFSPKYIGDIFKAAAMFGGPETPVRITRMVTGKPAVFTVADRDATLRMLLMPVRTV